MNTEERGMLKGCLITNAVLFVIGLLVSCAVLNGVISLAGWGIGQVTDTTEGVIDQTLDPDHALDAYQDFRSLRNDYEAAVENHERAQQDYDGYVDEMSEDRSTWTYSQEQEASRLRGVATGTRAYVNQLASEYNMKSESANWSIFKDLPIWDDEPLPEELEMMEGSE